MNQKIGNHGQQLDKSSLIDMVWLGVMQTSLEILHVYAVRKTHDMAQPT
jgi:hypothetical protein